MDTSGSDEKPERALRDQSRLLRSILDSMGDGVIALDRNGAFQLFNPKAREIFDIGQAATPDVWTPDWMTRYGVELLLPDAETPYPAAEIPLLRAMRGERIDRCEARLRKRSAPEMLIVLSITARPLVDEDGVIHGSVAVIRDVTARIEAQRRAVQSERLAAIGQMVTAVAHESRNALQQMQACSALLRWRLKGDEEALELVADLQKAQDRLLRLLEDIRNYAAPPTLDLQLCNLREVVTEAWESLAAARDGRNVTLREHIAAVSVECRADPLRLQQVLRNLLENSLAACDDPVVLDVEFSDAELHGAPATCVVVGDNGPGFTPEQQQRAFEAFFTTKPTGTGLGLGIARRIVEAHQGEIALGSRPGGGAEVRILLPKSGP